MRILRCVALACAVAVAAGDASAQTVIDIAPRAAAVTLGGRLQTQLQASTVDGIPADVFMRRARLRLDVRVDDFVDGRLNPDFAGGGVTLQDAWVRLSFDDAFRLTFGQFKRAFSLFELASSTDLPVIERDGRIEGLGGCAGVGGVCSFSRLTGRLAFDGRDRGVRLDGRARELSYMATLTNGEGIGGGDVNDAKSASGRLTWSAGGARIGLFGAVHDHEVEGESEETDTRWAEAFGVDVEVGTWRDGFHFLGGLVFGDNWAAGPDRRFTAFQVLGSYYVPLDRERIAGVEPLFRLGWADPDHEADDDGGLLLTPGVMLYFAGKNGVSLNVDTYAPGGNGDTGLSLKLQTYLYF